MYVTGMGRCSGYLHLIVQFPKIAACLCLLGAGGVWMTTDAQQVEAYCENPTAESYAVIREDLRTTADKVCFCLDGLCGPDQ